MFRFHYARAEQRINQKKFAAAIGTSVTALALMEQGRLQPNEEELQKMSEVLGIAPDLLMVVIEFNDELVSVKPQPVEQTV